MAHGMLINTTHLNRRANLIYVLVLALGVALTLYVNWSVGQVKNTSNRLIQNQLPILEVSRTIDRLFGEHERLLYEYYATVDTTLFTDAAVPRQSELKEALGMLAMYAGEDAVAPIHQQLDIVIKESNALHENLDGRSIDWDLSRAQLRVISDGRRAVLPALSALEARIGGEVNQGAQDTLGQVSELLIVVIVYGVVVLIFAFALGSYIKRYLLLSSTNERLAMFAERNPNPVLSLDESGQPLYQNPATFKLLDRLPTVAEPLALLSGSIGQQLFDARTDNSKSHRYEHQIGDRYFSYEVHWLEDLAAFDVHLKDITTQKRAQLQLLEKAYRNDQSGLYNRPRFNDDIGELIREGQGLTLVLVEVAQMGQLQGHYGLNGASACVDGVMHSLKRIFNEAIEQKSMKAELYHIADGSFALIVQHLANSSELQYLTQRIVECFRHPIATQLGQMRIQVQVGVTEHAPQQRTGTDLLLDAKIAVDQALRSGGNDVSYFDVTVGQAHARRVELARNLEHAIARDELTLVMQPQLSADGRRLIGGEALLRWQTNGKFVSPAEFIPVAEESGLILEIGDWVLDRACQMTAHYRELGLTDLVIAINISPRQFMQEGFVERVNQVLETYQLPPSSIELEITESTIMDNEDGGMKMLQELKQLGVSLAIDDFGTGYSSLSYLKQFPVDKLKIDRSFIQSIDVSTDDQAIVLSLCQLAKNLNLSVLAEGVESQPQLDVLAQFNCDAIQGYFFSKPLADSDFINFSLRYLADDSEKLAITEKINGALST
ncbi:bifunctional diguanylate cyclase/phosphodiesterase [Neiella marina]|uniref:Bifunctional diguanylate cyclase/phosphodiesterase n=1 Tax=Neiella holothuriorum TaxID=2870530 RepID=A0ABS7ECS8_9GAMM|nr:bifunctional diguanylate cyclase/phosphodiesterase [Neiella holothuriorum]MBW8190123.1 bifunctional diguanylate cyclase/phosphodiesterase [Neiella holothuriorum]